MGASRVTVEGKVFANSSTPHSRAHHRKRLRVESSRWGLPGSGCKPIWALRRLSCGPTSCRKVYVCRSEEINGVLKVFCLLHTCSC